MNPQMEKMMRAMGQEVPETKRIFELNPNHPITQAMKAEFDANPTSQKLKDMMRYSYMQALLLEGGEMENTADFITLTNQFAQNYLS